jgi:two-component system response regulator NreC
MNPISVLLAEDHTIVRKGVRSLLDATPGISVVGEAQTGRQALEQVETLQPDVVVMDVSMPDLNGIEATKQISRRYSDVKVIILTVHTDEEFVYQLLKAGASAYLVKQAAPHELVTAIHAVCRGESYLSPSVSRTVIGALIGNFADGNTHTNAPGNALTERELEVLQLLVEGHPPREIGERLFISEKTVRAHKSNIMDKLNLHTIPDLVKYAIHRGIISIE